MPLIGMPTLSTSAPSSSGGMICANDFLNLGELLGALFDAGADAQPHVHQDLAGVDGREEVAAEIGRQQERGADEGEKADDEDGAPPQAPVRARSR